MAKGYPMRITEEEAARLIKEKTSGRFSYVSGYKKKESKIVVRCSVCGELLERTYHHLTTAKCRNQCPICKAKESERIKAERRRIQELKRQQRLEQSRKRQIELEKKRAERSVPHHCPVCGELTIRKKYCSDKCSKKASNSSHEIRRRKKIKRAMVDRDITVDGLYKRDKGVCYLCGKTCDFEDFIMQGDTFIAGNLYPSIDHIVPLSKGGLHAWDNVKLAHRICNTLKSDKVKSKSNPLVQ